MRHQPRAPAHVELVGTVFVPLATPHLGSDSRSSPRYKATYRAVTAIECWRWRWFSEQRRWRRWRCLVILEQQHVGGIAIRVSDWSTKQQQQCLQLQRWWRCTISKYKRREQLAVVVATVSLARSSTWRTEPATSDRATHQQLSSATITAPVVVVVYRNQVERYPRIEHASFAEPHARARVPIQPSARRTVRVRVCMRACVWRQRSAVPYSVCLYREGVYRALPTHAIAHFTNPCKQVCGS